MSLIGKEELLNVAKFIINLRKLCIVTITNNILNGKQLESALLSH